MLTCRLFNIVLFFLSATASWSQIPSGFKIGKPIPLGHSHNDYEQERPLWEALENGFTSIEIDIFTAADNGLHVSHIPFALLQKPTLEKLYLAPLKEWIDKNGGQVFPDTQVTLTLMIDLKGNGSRTYPILKETLEKYKDYLTVYNKGRLVKQGPLRIMFSGSRPMSILNRETEQLFCIDGSLGGDYAESNVFVARESAPFSAYFKKRCNGKLSEKEEEDLKRLVEKTSAKNREIRFWAAGNKIKRWQTLKEAGVTVINVDKLKTFNRWINQQDNK